MVKIKLSSLQSFFYAMVLWMLLVYGGGYLSYINPWNRVVLSGLLVLLIFYIFISRIGFPKRKIYSMLFLLMYILLLFCLHIQFGVSFNSYASIVIGLFDVFFLNTIINDRNKFIRLYKNVMLFICIYSCCCYILNLVFNFTAVTPKTGNLYRLWLGQNIMYPSRNSGPFWEPGIFQIYINIALYFALFFREKNGQFQLWHALIYGITMLTTFSTTGYLVMAGILMWKFISVYRSIRDISMKIVIFFVLPIVLLLVGCIVISTPTVANKFDEDNGSYKRRSADLEEVIPIITESGPFGLGAQSSARDMLMMRHGIGLSGRGNSIAYSSTGSMYGWITLLLIMFFTLRSCYMNFREQWLLLYGILLISWATESLMLIPLYYFILVGFKIDTCMQNRLNIECIKTGLLIRLKFIL